MKKLDEEARARPSSITSDDLGALDEIRKKYLETSVLITAAADFASTIKPSTEIERLQALVIVAEKSATDAFTAIEGLIARIDERRDALSTATPRRPR